MINIASHNSMTYLPVKQWWLKPFSFMAKCQSVPITKQYITYNVRMFDLRVSFDKNGKPYFKHGIFKYKGDVYNVLDWIAYVVIDPIVRINLEEEIEFCNPRLTNLFFNFCKEIEDKYDITFIGGTYKRGGIIYRFNNQVRCKELYASVTKKYGIFDDMFPWIYAYFNNKKDRNKINKEFGTYYDYLMQDFVNI